MKKMKFLLCALFAVLACAAFTACGDDDDDDDGPGFSSIVGSWQDVTWLDEDCYADYTFNPDGTMTASEYDEGHTRSASGTYSFDGSILSIRIYWSEHNMEPYTYTVRSMSAGTMVLEDDEGDIFTWVRR